MKIIVIGCAGSGKTTIATQLASYLDITLYTLDNFFWQPGWQKTSRDKFKEDIKDVLSLNSWIIDGMYPELLELLKKEGKEDFILLYVKTTKWRSIFKVLKRTIFRIMTKEEICNGNVETISNLVGESSIIPYSLKTYEETKRICEEIILKYRSSKTITSNICINELIEDIYLISQRKMKFY